MMDDNYNKMTSDSGGSTSGSKIKGLGDFLLILRDRWLIALTLSLPVALAYIYIKSQGLELYRSSSSFRLIPPPAILNLQKVDRDQHVQGLVAKHLDGLNSQDLRLNVVQKIKDSPELKSELLSPYLKDGISIDVGATISYSVSVSPPSEGRPRFSINSTVGVLGIFDPATKISLKSYDEDFGQTLGIWGFDTGSYWMTPIVGPYTTRHSAGDLIDNFFNPINYIDNGVSRYGLKIIDKIQERSDLSPLEDELYGSYDPYQYLRDSYLQNRNYKLKNGVTNEEDMFEDIDFEDF